MMLMIDCGNVNSPGLTPVKQENRSMTSETDPRDPEEKDKMDFGKVKEEANIQKSEEVKKYSCTQCGKGFNYRCKRDRHTKDSHVYVTDNNSMKRVKKEYKCSKCSYATKKESNWRRHQSRADHLPNWKPKQKPQCNNCHKEFPEYQRQRLRIHENKCDPIPLMLIMI